jgi:hypothetical protein
MPGNLVLSFLALKKAASAAFFTLASLLHAFGVLLFAASWLAYDHYRPWVNFHSESLAFFGVGLFVASRCMMANNEFSATPKIIFWVFAVMLVPWIQYVLNISFFAGDALMGSLFLYGLAAAIWLGFSYAKGSNDEQLLLPVFCVLWIVAIVSAAIGLLQWLNLQDYFTVYVVQTDFGDRAMGNLGQPNQLATLMLIGIASLIWTFEKKQIGVTGLVAGVAFLTLALVLTRSRSGMLSGLVMSGFLLWKCQPRASRLKPSYIFVWAVTYGICLLATPYVQDFLILGDSRSMNVAVDIARPIIWKQVLTGISHAPWFGYGWNQTPTAHSFGSIAVPGLLTYTNAHNIVLDLVAWTGIPLGLFLTGLCGWWFVSRIYRVSQVNAVYAMAALLPVLVHSMVEYPFAYSYFLLASGLMIGIVEAEHVGLKTACLKRWWIAGSLAIWFVIGGGIVHEYLQIEKDFVVVRFENLRVGQTPTEYMAPHIVLLSHMGAMLDALREKAKPDMSPEALESLRKASLRFSQGPLNLRYAIALGLNGFPVEATRQFAIIRGMYGPRYYQAAVNAMRELQAEKYPELSQVVTR